MSESPAAGRPIGWWLKTADARIDQAFEAVFHGQSITRREWQVLESTSGAPVRESELLGTLKSFAGAGEAVDELRRRGLLVDGADGFLTLTHAGQLAHDGAAAGVATVRRAVRTALPGENYPTLLRLLADLVDGL
ncbi:MAG: hypothetical protein ABJA16_04080 [Nakamurella sp.]